MYCVIYVRFLLGGGGMRYMSSAVNLVYCGCYWRSYVEIRIDLFSINTTSQIRITMSEVLENILRLGVVLLSLVPQILRNLLAITWP
jgi:hypothetical protein